MNIPFLGKYGTKYGGTTGVTDPGNTGDFVEVAAENASDADYWYQQRLRYRC